MKFLTRERSKLGSAPGTIIQWALPVVDGDPDGSSNANDLPAGYLKCDGCLLYTSPSPRDKRQSRMPSSA